MEQQEHPVPAPASASRVPWQCGWWGPTDPDQHPAVQAIREHFPEAFVEATTFRDEMTIRIQREALRNVVAFLRENPALRYNHLTDITAVDMLYLREAPRFDVVVQLYSIPRRQRLRIKCGVEDGETVPSLVPIFAGANWFEREVFDMFGIVFEGHPDLRRILLPEDWDEGHPLRKDYPLRGYRDYVQPGYESPVPRIHGPLRRL
ncbi:NADH-quinone oxidoreductase subunit C [Thermorudis peleae]|uniref:NADH-quinone oxidoreductase subunit C n=1 Tax=Thermorudis peleae TaxID=1382356 RepID=UPI0006896438|nr:NADH-quinone oxidoreductase subunit C [Thermorudis peleae]